MGKKGRGGARPGAGRPPRSESGKATVQILLKLTELQAAIFDEKRGPMSRQEYLIHLITHGPPVESDGLGYP